MTAAIRWEDQTSRFKTGSQVAICFCAFALLRGANGHFADERQFSHTVAKINQAGNPTRRTSFRSAPSFLETALYSG